MLVKLSHHDFTVIFTSFYVCLLVNYRISVKLMTISASACLITFTYIYMYINYND